MPKRTNQIPAVLMPSPVLITESEEEFNSFCDALKDDLKVPGTIDHLLINDIAELSWEIRRYRRVKISLINSAILPALKKLLTPIVRRQRAESQKPKKRIAQTSQGLIPNFNFEPDEADLEMYNEVDRLAHGWFVDDKTKQLILKMFEEHKLDDYAIETEAMRIVGPELEKLDRLLASLEWRLNKSLRCLAELRGGFLRHLRASVERVIDGEILAPDSASTKKPPASA
jgi:hypothetical protein